MHQTQKPEKTFLLIDQGAVKEFSYAKIATPLLADIQYILSLLLYIVKLNNSGNKIGPLDYLINMSDDALQVANYCPDE